MIPLFRWFLKKFSFVDDNDTVTSSEKLDYNAEFFIPTKEKGFTLPDIPIPTIMDTGLAHFSIPKSGYRGADVDKENFKGMAKRCTMGDLKAMLWMFRELRRQLPEGYEEEESFYINNKDFDTQSKWLQKYIGERDFETCYRILGSCMWLNRAAIYGSEEAIELILTLSEGNIFYQYFPDVIETPNYGDNWGRFANYIELNNRSIADMEENKCCCGIINLIKLFNIPFNMS